MIKVVVINGMPGCGKTTFEEMCSEYVNNQPPGFFEYGKFTFVRILSTVDFVKSIAKECGWDGSKTLKNRKLFLKFCINSINIQDKEDKEDKIFFYTWFLEKDVVS